jgi:outer membrane lipoprotein-sorting protein
MRYVTKNRVKPLFSGGGLSSGRMVAILCQASFVLLTASSFGDNKDSAEQMLAQLDRIRLPTRSFVVDLAITDFRQGKREREGTFRLYSRRTPNGFDFLALCLTPPGDRSKLLLSKGDRLWFYDPKSARAVPVSPSQFRSHSFILDLFGNPLSSNYSAEFEGGGSTTDLARREVAANRLRLTSRGRGKTGATMRYWLDKESNRPMKSEMFSSSGKLLLIVYYSEFRNVLGEQRATRLVVVNPVEASVNEVKFSSFAYRNTPDPVFEETLLPGAVTLLR